MTHRLATGLDRDTRRSDDPHGRPPGAALAEAVDAAVSRAFDAQTWLAGWRPTRAAVLGSNDCARLAMIALQRRGLDVCAFDNYDAESRDTHARSVVRRVDEVDLVVDANGTYVPGNQARVAIGRRGARVEVAVRADGMLHSGELRG